MRKRLDSAGLAAAGGPRLGSKRLPGKSRPAPGLSLPRTPKERLVRFGAPALALCLMVLSACDDASPPSQPPPRPIAWAEVQVADGAIRQFLPGVVRAVQRASIGFEVGGLVEAVRVEVGDSFQTGDELGRLDARTRRLTRDERASEVVRAKATLREAEQHFARQQSLNEQGWATKATLDTAKASLDTARGWLEIAQARLALADKALADTVLRAPYDGVVARRLVEPAQQVEAGQAVLEIQGDGGDFEVAVAVAETLVDDLRPGDIHSVSFPARPSVSDPARIAEIGTDAGSAGTFPVTLRLVSSKNGLRAGMTAEVAFDAVTPGGEAQPADPNGATHRNPIVSIPVTAFLSGDGSETFAFVFNAVEDAGGGGTGVLERRTITLGPVTSDRAIVLKGLAPGDIVATRGLPFLRAGQPVTRLGVGAKRYD